MSLSRITVIYGTNMYSSMYWCPRRMPDSGSPVALNGLALCGTRQASALPLAAPRVDPDRVAPGRRGCQRPAQLHGWPCPQHHPDAVSCPYAWGPRLVKGRRARASDFLSGMARQTCRVGDTRLRVEDDADVVGNDFGRSFLLLPDGKHFTQTSYHERQRLCSVGSL